MDSAEKSSSMNDFIKVNNDNKAKNLKGTSRQWDLNDRGDNVFTSVSSQTEPNIVPQNGPRVSELNSLSINETGQSSNLCVNSSDCCKHPSSASQSQSQICSSGGNVDKVDSSNSRNIDSITRNNGVESNQETQSWQKLNKTPVDKVGSNNYNLHTPSTSKGVGKSCDISESSSFNKRKRPSSLTLNKHNLDGDDSSSDTGNDDYSLGSEDGCIYTYRGGEHLADLPSSFFSLDMGLPLEKHLPHPNYAVPQVPAQNARDQGSHASSPDMDFLEMDFDPGPSCEADTGDESTPDADLEAASNMPEENEPVYRAPSSPEYVAGARHNPLLVNVAVGLTSHYYEDHNYYSIPSTSRGIEKPQEDSLEGSRNHQTYGPYITHVNPRGEQFLVRRTMSHWPTSMPTNLHVSSGDLVSPREMLTYDEQHAEATPYAYQINQGERPTVIECMNLFHLTMAKRLLIEKTKSDSENHEAASVTAEASASACIGATGTSVVEVQRSMVWSEIEACERQVTQIGTSACGATAIVNVFNALGVPVNLEQINSSVGTRHRANNAPLPRYLMSRAIAGCTAADLVAGIHRASDGLVTARFFPTHPERAFSLSHWLADWISLGAVPILTLNLQAGCENDIPDAWHHQMVFGVSPRGIYLCNPIECVRETTIWPRLTSPSVLLVRCRDVLSRWTPITDLTPLMAVPDRRFYSFNVLGQVANVIREWRMNGHIRIPASYQAGITVATLTGSEAHRRLMHAAQLPILGPHADTT